MCQILSTDENVHGGFSPCRSAMLTGEGVDVLKGTRIKNIDMPFALELTCVHPDGRSDSYSLLAGQILLVDEDAELTIINAEAVADHEKKKQEEAAALKEKRK